MNRVLLVNLVEEFPEREHIDTVDRAAGDLFFANLGLEYGGYILSEDNCLAAQWIVPDDKVKVLLNHLYTNTLEGYEPQVYVGREQPNGCTEEQRVL